MKPTQKSRTEVGMLKKIWNLGAALLVFAAGSLCFAPVRAFATSMTGVTVANPTAQSASPTVTNLTVTGTLTVAGAASVLQSGTTTQIASAVNPLGTLYRITELVAGTAVTNAYNLGMATAAAVDSCVYIAVSTSVPAVAGAACHN